MKASNASRTYADKIHASNTPWHDALRFLAACCLSACGSSTVAQGTLDAGDAEIPWANDADVSAADLPGAIDLAATDSAEAQPIDAPTSPIDGAAPSAFVCGSLGAVASDVSQRLCYDFSDPAESNEFTSEAGTWSVMDGAYHVTGPINGQVTCPGDQFSGTAMTTSVLTTLRAADVRVHARMTSWTRPDKVLVLRSQPSGDRIELNFRSHFDNGNLPGGDDISISALIACRQVFFVLPNVIQLSQLNYQAIVVDVQLRGQRLTIAVDGNQLYDDIPIATDLDGGLWQLPTAPGSVGFGVFLDGESVFDDLIVEVLK